MKIIDLFNKYNGVKLKELQRIKEISFYNNNYYIGKETYNGSTHKDLIFAKSDDDNTTELYLVNNLSGMYKFAECYTSDNDTIICEKEDNSND